MEKNSAKNAHLERKSLLENRPPAKKLSDVELSENIYKPDFQIGDKYSDYSTEIIRLSLLGLAGYGFLISNILIKILEASSKNGTTEGTLKLPILPIYHFIISIVGVLSLGVSLGLSLYHRFNVTSCLYDQILISRSLSRLQNSHWTDEEKEKEKEVLAIVRKCQSIDARRYEKILFWSGLFLFIGFFCVVIIFFLVLFDIFKQ